MSRILVVDDEPGIREVLRELLGTRGHALIEADTWREATQILDTHCIQVAIVDGQLPRDGTAPCVGAYGRVLCQQARALGVQTVLLSGNDDLVDQERRAGFRALKKPFDVRDLLAAVERPTGADR